MTTIQEPAGLPARAGWRRPAVRRPSPAIAISLVALAFAMSGTAYAATGGTFILGRANTANRVSSLSDSKGTALHLSAGHGKPPLTVSNSVRVPNLNASKLGGIPASGFIVGTGKATSGQVTVHGQGATAIAMTPRSALIGQCDDNGATGADLFLSLGTGASASWWNFNGVDNSSNSAQVTPESKFDFMVVAQVTEGSTVATYIASQTYDAGSDTCSFTAQLLTTG
jgi:hypothetical protein